MYRIEIKEDVSAEKWGAFTCIKEMNVVHDSIQSINGFIVQQVIKQSQAAALCKGVLKKIDIEEFTSQKVKYMNHSYYEIFPVIDGEAVDNDQFQNGPILRYQAEKGAWYADNNPPTMGIIVQKGRLFFIPADESEVNKVIAFMKKNNRVRIPREYDLFGIKWFISSISPANGLLYCDALQEDALLHIAATEVIVHTVIAKWNGVRSITRSLSTAKSVRGSDKGRFSLQIKYSKKISKKWNKIVKNASMCVLDESNANSNRREKFAQTMLETSIQME